MQEGKSLEFTGSQGEEIRLILPVNGKNASLTVDGEQIVSSKEYNRSNNKVLPYDAAHASFALELKKRGLSIVNMPDLPIEARLEAAAIMDSLTKKDGSKIYSTSRKEFTQARKIAQETVTQESENMVLQYVKENPDAAASGVLNLYSILDYSADNVAGDITGKSISALTSKQAVVSWGKQTVDVAIDGSEKMIITGTKKTMATALAKQLGVTYNEALKLFNQGLTEVTETVARGRSTYIVPMTEAAYKSLPDGIKKTFAEVPTHLSRVAGTKSAVLSGMSGLGALLTLDSVRKNVKEGKYISAFVDGLLGAGALVGGLTITIGGTTIAATTTAKIALGAAILGVCKGVYDFADANLAEVREETINSLVQQLSPAEYKIALELAGRGVNLEGPGLEQFILMKENWDQSNFSQEWINLFDDIGAIDVLNPTDVIDLDEDMTQEDVIDVLNPIDVVDLDEAGSGEGSTEDSTQIGSFFLSDLMQENQDWIDYLATREDGDTRAQNGSIPYWGETKSPYTSEVLFKEGDSTFYVDDKITALDSFSESGQRDPLTGTYTMSDNSNNSYTSTFKIEPNQTDVVLKFGPFDATNFEFINYGNVGYVPLKYTISLDGENELKTLNDSGDLMDHGSVFKGILDISF